MSKQRAFVIQQQAAETIAGNGTQLWLLADASDCCGALGANRLRLEAGAAGVALAVAVGLGRIHRIQRMTPGMRARRAGVFA